MGLNTESGFAALWQRTLAAIPTLPGRFEYLTSLRNGNTGQYEHFGITQKVGPAEADRQLRNSHLDLFQTWLCFGLQRQKEELEQYLEGLEGDKRQILGNWLSLEPYTTWVPAGTRDVERQLFISDFQIVLDLIRTDYGVASRDPDS